MSKSIRTEWESMGGGGGGGHSPHDWLLTRVHKKCQKGVFQTYCIVKVFPEKAVFLYFISHFSGTCNNQCFLHLIKNITVFRNWGMIYTYMYNFPKPSKASQELKKLRYLYAHFSLARRKEKRRERRRIDSGYKLIAKFPRQGVI